MTQDLIVMKLEPAVRMLAECSSPEQAKRVADLAHAAEVYARRQQLGEQAVAYATGIKVDATTMLGEFLKEAPKATGAKGVGPIAVPDEYRNGAPTLADIGISKKESANAQTLADIKEEDPELHEKVRTGAVPVSKAVKVQRQRRKKAKAEKVKEAPPTPGLPEWEVITGDCCLELAKVPAGSARLVFADPPYNIGIDYADDESDDLLPYEEYLDWFERWLLLASAALAPDGSLWVLIGDEYAAEYVLALKRLGLTMRNWIKWYETFGVNCPTKFNRTSRHLLYFVKDAGSFVFNREHVSRASDRQTKYQDPRACPDGKTLDDVWADVPRLAGSHAERIDGFPTQLPVALLRRVVLCATEPGDLVIDPFNGSGTTGAAALAHGRRYLGIERSEEYAALARKRLRSVQREFIT